MLYTEAEENERKLRDAANRLHHLSMRYVGAFAELARGGNVGLLPQGTPGMREMRDLIDLILLTRAEINTITHFLIEKKICTAEEFTKRATDDYKWLTEQKAWFLGCEVTDFGLSFKAGPPDA